MKHQIVIN